MADGKKITKSLTALIDQAFADAAQVRAEVSQYTAADETHKWSIPDRKIALKYLIAVKGGMDPRQWAQLHPAEWERLIQVAPPDATGEDVASMGPPLSNEAGANVGIVPIACRGAR